MVTTWHHIIVSFKVVAQKEFIGTLLSWVKCIGERLTGEKRVLMGARQTYGLQGASNPYIQHPPTLAWQEQPGTPGVKKFLLLKLFQSFDHWSITGMIVRIANLRN